MATNKTKKQASKIDLFNHMDILILRKRSIGKIRQPICIGHPVIG